MAYWVDSDRAALAIAPRPRGGDWLETDIQALRRDQVDILVSLLTTSEEHELGLHEEASVCKQAGIQFQNFSIQDRGVPSSIQDFVALVDALHDEMLQGKRIAAHCRAGIGRSSLLIATLLRKNGYTAEQAFEMLSKARGLTVPDTQEQVEWVKRLAFS